ncbi:MAG: bacteriophage abortive infection AbiH family protein [Nitrincola lacisaponensis]|uniref:bacteriophage abortive infection AbiH family protein n=1 Tax=Nitrincola lacisaponensis TaxID=267850 RepID=UPI00391BB7A0
MRKLYIIGNGFDLWHDLPTGYDQFCKFAKETLEEIENYYLLDATKEVPWHDFENSLADFNWSEFFDCHNHLNVDSENFRPSFTFGLEDDLREQADQIVEKIRDCFRDWVNGIDASVAERRLAIKEDSQYINFNYTSTLETIYGIDKNNVLHIHGRAEACDELIFGHGKTMLEEPELDVNGDSNSTMFSDAEGAAKYPFHALKKPVNEILERNKRFFNSLKNIDEILVIGHSLNNIDLPYFKKLAKCAQNTEWLVCCYNIEKKEDHVQKLVECGALRERIRVCEYSELEIR